MSVVDSDAERQTEPVQNHWWSRSDREGIEATLTRTSGEHVFRRCRSGRQWFWYAIDLADFHGGERGWEPSKGESPSKRPCGCSPFGREGAWPSPPRSMDWLARSSAQRRQAPRA